MLVKIAAVPMLFALSLAAQQAVPPSEMLEAKTIHATADELLKQAKASKDGLAFKQVVTRADGGEQICARVKTGQGEWHHDFEDVLIALEGEAQIVTGGTVVNGKETAPGEIRGDGVTGGKTQRFAQGDVIRIEPQVAHQIVMAPGGSLKYMAVKIKTEK